MKTETEVRRDVLQQMRYYRNHPKCAYSVYIIETLKEVLEEDNDHFVLPHRNYSHYDKSSDGYYNGALAVAHISTEDREKTELAVAVDLYNKNGKWVNSTDGWLISQFDDYEGVKILESRCLFVPKPPIALEWETDGNEFFNDGRPIRRYSDQYSKDEEPKDIGWTDIETGDALH